MLEYQAYDIAWVNRIKLQLIHEMSLQADVLLKYLMQDPRKVVKNHALADLKMLAKGTPHMWRLQHIEVCMFNLYLKDFFFELSS